MADRWTGEDRLLSATRHYESIQAEVNRQKNDLRQDLGLVLEAQRNDIAQKQLDTNLHMQKMELWKQDRAATAASYSAAEVPKIDMDAPDAEKQLGNWMSYAQANGVESGTFKDIFGPRLNELAVKKELRARETAETLGAEGLGLYDALRKYQDTLSPDQARDVAIQSSQAKSTLAYWQKFAEDKGVAFIPTPEDMAQIKKRVGDIPSGAQGVFDPRPVYYDMDGVNEVVAKYITPELKKLANSEAAKAERDAREQEATIGLKTAQGKEAEANATKATFEANIYKNIPTGAATPYRAQSPAANLFDF